MSTKAGQGKTERERRERYIHDYESAHAKTVVRGRTADVHGAFFLPYLRPGMSVLDCGCGPGTITVGLAQAVAPGEVVGVDTEASQVDLARANAAAAGLTNLRFEMNDVYRLPYADDTFDAAFSHALMEHVSDPVTAVKEMHRVLKPGGVVGIRSPDWAGALIAPADPVLEAALEMHCRFRQESGGDPYMGRRLRAVLRAAGFPETVGTASYGCWGTADAVQSIVDVMLTLLAGPRIVEQATALGWADDAAFQDVRAAVRRWAAHPDAFFVHAWCEGVAWKAPGAAGQ